MTPERKQHAIDACLTVAMLVLVLLGVRAHAATLDVYLPLVHGQAIRTTGAIPPPAGTSCQLQTSADIELDPRTDELVYSCESRNGHGFIVWTRNRRMILDHVATGSGSLKVIDGAVWAVAVRDDGALETVIVPAVTP